MPRVGLFLGGGSLPQTLINVLAEQDALAAVVCVYGQTNPHLKIPSLTPTLWTKLGPIKPILEFFQANDVDTLTLVGPVGRPALSELSLDPLGLQWIRKLGWKALKGDDSLLSGLIHLIEGQGFPVVAASHWLKDLFISEGIATQRTPSQDDWKDIHRGLEILKVLSPLDIGQSIILQQGLVLGIEAIEGTAELIHRCGKYRRPLDQGVLVKTAKREQSLKVDLPTIGPDTIQSLKASGFVGIAIEAGKTQILDKKVVIGLCNQAGLFLVGIRAL
jgi:DUF1009 family protein